MTKNQFLILAGLAFAILVICAVVIIAAYTMIDQVTITLPAGDETSVPTRIPTTIPIPTATTDDAPKVEFLDDRSYDSGNYMITEGQIKNISNQTLAFIKIVVEFYDDDDHFVTSDWDYAEFTTLEPGETSPFKIMTPYESGTTIYELSASYMPLPAD